MDIGFNLFLGFRLFEKITPSFDITTSEPHKPPTQHNTQQISTNHGISDFGGPTWRCTIGMEDNPGKNDLLRFLLGFLSNLDDTTHCNTVCSYNFNQFHMFTMLYIHFPSSGIHSHHYFPSFSLCNRNEHSTISTTRVSCRSWSAIHVSKLQPHQWANAHRQTTVVHS